MLQRSSFPKDHWCDWTDRLLICCQCAPVAFRRFQLSWRVAGRGLWLAQVVGSLNSGVYFDKEQTGPRQASVKTSWPLPGWPRCSNHRLWLRLLRRCVQPAASHRAWRHNKSPLSLVHQRLPPNKGVLFFFFKDQSLKLCSISVQLLCLLPVGWWRRLR